MIDNPISILDKLVVYILELLDTELMYLKPIQILLMAAFMVATYFFVKYLVKSFIQYGAKGFLIAQKPLVVMYITTKDHKKNKRVCSVCKNTLDKCVCPSNRGVSYSKRVSKWKQQQKQIRQNAKLKKIELEKINKPVALKKKRNGGK